MSDKFKIKPERIALSERIEKLMSIDANGRSDNKDVFRTIATEDGRNVDQMISDDEYRSDFNLAAHLATGRLSKKAFLDNKDLTKTEIVFDIGRNTLEINFDKHQRVDNRIMDPETKQFKIDGKKDVFGDSTLKFKVRGTKNSGGDLKVQREFFQDDFSHVPEFKAFAS